ncbi:PREDICTED: probable phenylalanine--tRNA ligase, mitochondrial [Nicrophorus vespilloides]|uniref:phenylalanine--tRNA ligase n=1 Tax=Nicrophorus vespilloides TaxID=110193 RepID=A0ABM1N472_NICVS|nr:PREDICTED: probable phenylalanine--tRNA ligase, mitochondrial [Nicrophorus vespilloides]
MLSILRPGASLIYKPTFISRFISNVKVEPQANSGIEVNGNFYLKDEYTNVTPKILSYLNRNLHIQQNHPLCLVRDRIVNYFYKSYKNSRGNPIFSVYDNISPVVSVQQNFDSLLIEPSHPSRTKSDCYYINNNYLLRGHTTAHQSELIQAGLDSFLVIGDVYRRDEIDSTHFPVFHQIDAVRLHTRDQLFKNNDELQLFELGDNVEGGKQTCHTLEAVKLLEHQLKQCLVGLAQSLFGKDVEYRWVETQFPFTCPSWELELKYKDDWLELLGCGIMKQPILTEAGVVDQIGWAFGLGLERVAMKLYQIPDIRLFWSQDSGFLNQFKTATADTNVVYKTVSQFPQCKNDISFWLAENGDFNSNDFYDLVRTVGGDIVEQVNLVDSFVHPKSKQTSHCYRITYRHMEKTLTQEEVNLVHKKIEDEAAEKLGVKIR